MTEDGIWGKPPRPYGHLLPAHLWDLNLIPDIRADCKTYFKDKEKKWHKGFHHLSSSQAFALNLFYPLLQHEKSRGAVANALGEDDDIAAWEFEAILDREELTNFDLILETSSGRRIYIEVKLTESQFGRAAGTDRQREKLADIYQARLEGRLTRSFSERELFANYQLVRNLCYADHPPGSTVVLFMPYANETARGEAHTFLSEHVSKRYQKYVKLVFAEDFVRRVIEQGHVPESVLPSLLHVAGKYDLSRT